ncbi:hypothetical protein GGR56DRAFT_583344 [Xylariaceae sp. FL0804]|nr:hypothetical protein GGR56DRAFT_583344 [Xylariaceae sp. FL0804]
MAANPANQNKPEHLIIVCCHGIWLGGSQRGFDEGEWLIAGFQAGETPTFIEHIKAGLQALAADEKSVLIFSGGPTRNETRESEASTYRDLAAANSYFDILPYDSESSSFPPAAGQKRILCEERALDSYSNVLFSLAQFWRAHAAWPRRMTIVSHAFKQQRLVDGHCAAIGFPPDRVRFVGIDPPGMEPDGTRGRAALAGAASAVAQWRRDPHGTGEVLAGKRARRNPWHVTQELFTDREEAARSGVRVELVADGRAWRLSDVPQPWS